MHACIHSSIQQAESGKKADEKTKAQSDRKRKGAQGRHKPKGHVTTGLEKVWWRAGTGTPWLARARNAMAGVVSRWAD